MATDIINNRAFVTLALMTHFLTSMNPTGKLLIAQILTGKILHILTARDLFLALSAITVYYYSLYITLWTRTRMTLHWTWMGAILSSFLTAFLSTSMRNYIAVVFRVFFLPTEALISWHLLLIEEIAFRTTPVINYLILS